MEGGFEFFQDNGFRATSEEGHEAVGALDRFSAYWLPARSHRTVAGGACEAGSNIWEGGSRRQHVDDNNGEIITDLTSLSTNCCSLYVLTCITFNVAQWLSLKCTRVNGYGKGAATGQDIAIHSRRVKTCKCTINKWLLDCSPVSASPFNLLYHNGNTLEAV